MTTKRPWFQILLERTNSRIFKFTPKGSICISKYTVKYLHHIFMGKHVGSVCSQQIRGHTPNQSGDHELSPFSKTNLHNKWCCNVILQIYSRRKHVTICESKKRCFRTSPCCNIQLCWSLDAANNVFFCGSEDECGKKKKKKKDRQPVKGCAKDVAVGYLLMWCGTQPTPTRQYVSLLW